MCVSVKVNNISLSYNNEKHCYIVPRGLIYKRDLAYFIISKTEDIDTFTDQLFSQRD